MSTCRSTYMFTNMGNEDILQKIRNGIYRLAPKRKGKSRIWDLFAEVRKDDSSILEGFLCCRKCVRLYRYDGKATSNLNRHKCYSSISKPASVVKRNFALNEDSHTDDDFKDCSLIEILDAHSESQGRETFFRGNEIQVVKKCGSTPKRAQGYAKQVESLCEIFKSDLEDDTEEYDTNTHAFQQETEDDIQHCETYTPISMDIDILQNIRRGVYKLSQKRKGKSNIWNTFAEIRMEDGSIFQGYVCCRKCMRLFKFDGMRTSNLNRHKCYSLISKENSAETDVLHDDYSSTVSDDENIRASDPLAPQDALDEVQLYETPPRIQKLCSSNEKSPNYLTLKTNLNQKFSKQIDSLCEMIKSDLHDLPEELFYNAKWKIMDVLRDVHKAKLENKREPRRFGVEKRKSSIGTKVNAAQSVTVSSSTAGPKTMSNVLEFFAQEMSSKKKQ